MIRAHTRPPPPAAQQGLYAIREIATLLESHAQIASGGVLGAINAAMEAHSTSSDIVSYGLAGAHAASEAPPPPVGGLVC